MRIQSDTLVLDYFIISGLKTENKSHLPTCSRPSVVYRLTLPNLELRSEFQQ